MNLLGDFVLNLIPERYHHNFVKVIFMKQLRRRKYSLVIKIMLVIFKLSGVPMNVLKAGLSLSVSVEM